MAAETSVTVIDTSVLSLAFRRPSRSAAPEHPAVLVLRRLIVEDAALGVPGFVLQELLSGVRAPEQFTWLADRLSSFPLLLASRQTHLQAAEISNTCRTAGIAAAVANCLVAAHAMGRGNSLLTTDQDFSRIARVCGLRLHRPSPQ